MNKQNYLYGIIGLLLGLIIGYIGTDAINRNAPNASAAINAGGDSTLPASGPASAGAGGGPQAGVVAAIDQARREPGNFDAQMKAAEQYKQIGRTEGALEFYEAAAKVKPNDVNLLVALGNAYFDLKRYTDAERWYQSALKVNAKDATIWMDLGSSYYLREPRELDKAIAAYRSALKADPRHEKSLQNLTRALLDKGDKAAARASLQQLEQVNPSNSAIPQLRAETN
jgi:tetratricopeptide (TPR) repeat protein